MAVTMSLMLILFAAFFAINYANDYYSNVVDTSSTLEHIADSGVFTNVLLTNDDEYVTEEIADEDSLIVGIIVDKNGKILSQQKIGNGKSKPVNQTIIDKILSQKSDKMNYKSYVFTVKELGNGNKLIVLQDISVKNNSAARVLSTIALILFGIISLALLTFFLSKFITEPARKALEREKQFVSDASHELKTPISVISINAQALNMDSENIHLKNILSETDRMNSLIENLLTLSRYEEVPLRDKSDCLLSDIVKEISLTYESIAFEKEIGYQYDIEESITVRGDENELKQLAVILIDNAIKNTEPLGLVTIALSKKNNHCLFEVKNTGKGIAEKDIPHIFERFYSSSSSRNDNSFGLGLSIAKSIVERHNGTITVKSEIDEETTFTVILN